MGWLCTSLASHFKRNGSVDRKAELDERFTETCRGEDGEPKGTYRVLKSTMVGTVYYAAVERTFMDGRERIVFGLVCLTCGKDRRHGTLWGYKDMDETMGPYCHDCPPSILDLLTPTGDEYAIEWRRKCRENAAKKKEPPVLVDGVHVWYQGGWVCTSNAYMSKTGNRGIRYGRGFHRESALARFLEDYGTPEQKEAFTAKTGKEVA